MIGIRLSAFSGRPCLIGDAGLAQPFLSLGRSYTVMSARVMMGTILVLLFGCDSSGEVRENGRPDAGASGDEPSERGRGMRESDPTVDAAVAESEPVEPADRERNPSKVTKRGCGAIRREFRRVLAAGHRDCETNSDCGLWSTVMDLRFACPSPIDCRTADRIRALDTEFMSRGCPRQNEGCYRTPYTGRSHCIDKRCSY